MSWINFNESLSSLKGQISNFANNVLAEDSEESAIQNSDNDELKNICIRQEKEIISLRKLIEDLNEKNQTVEQNGTITNDHWTWEEAKSSKTPNTQNEESVSSLNTKIKELEKEKEELFVQLEELDRENQQNISKIMGMKEKLQEENVELKDNCDRLKQQNKNITSKAQGMKRELEELKSKLEESKTIAPPEGGGDSENFRNKYEVVLQENQTLKNELEEAKKKISVLNSSTNTLKKVLEDLKVSSAEEESKINQLESDNKVLLAELQQAKLAVQEFEKKSLEDTENCKKLAFILETYEKQVSCLKEDIRKYENSASSNDSKESQEQLLQELDKYKKNYEQLLSEKNEEHKKYVNMLTDNVKKYVECENPSDFPQDSRENDPQMSEFSKQVQNILKILIDFKFKCETLEKNLCEVSQEKTKLLTEKNHEIEKLMENSEILSQEVITKTQTIKEYEHECNELAKNNDILISELEAYKSNSGLQTISESNEDNIVDLESQLDNSKKKIEELEETINQLESEMKVVKSASSSNSSEEAQLQINKLTTDLNNQTTDYQLLISNFDHLQIEKGSLTKDIEFISKKLEAALAENEELKNGIEKLKADNENSEYQCAEVNINMDSMKEENDVYKSKIDVLIKENDKLQMLNSDFEKNNEYLRSQLNEITEKFILEEDKRKEFEMEIRNLTEKLKLAKMTETSLKLQYDTVNKELAAMTDSKINIESSLNKINVDLQQFQQNFLEVQEQNDKLSNSKQELEKLLENKEETIAELQNVIADLKMKKEKIIADEKNLLEENSATLETVSLDESSSGIDGFQNLKTQNMEFEKCVEDLKLQLNSIIEEKENLQKEYNNLLQVQNDNSNYLEKINILEKQVEEINASRNELINIVTTKHQESITYHSEIQRLSQILNAESLKCRNLELQLEQQQIAQSSNDEIEKLKGEIEKLTDQNNFLKEKCDILADNLISEQSKVQSILAEKPSASEKELALSKKLERLQTHLIEVEEHYTEELLQAEKKNADLQAKVNEIQQREKNSSTMYTSVSIRANQQVETLQSQLQMITNQRDELRKKISDSEDQSNKQGAALANLQFVLEQFQKDKDKDVQKETERIRRQINAEKQVQEELKNEISNLQSQLSESKQGLQAASRLSDQLEHSKRLVVTLKEEVAQLQEKLKKSEENLKSASNQHDGKVDKTLIKNLVLGFITSNNNMNKDQTQILKIIATVLDFNQQDHDKVNLNKAQQSSWLGSLLSPPPGQNMSQESLSQAFIKFLENESKPRVIPSLLSNTASSEAATRSENSSRPSTARQSPIVLSEIVLPTFADFGTSRNSSSILKGVLKDNND